MPTRAHATPATRPPRIAMLTLQLVQAGNEQHAATGAHQPCRLRGLPAPAAPAAATRPHFPSLPQLTGTVTEAPIVGSPTEVYERIARGVLACWFGTTGPLKVDYVYHAEAEPAARAAKPRSSSTSATALSDNPKGLRAYRIAITPATARRRTLLFENSEAARADGEVDGGGRPPLGRRARSAAQTWKPAAGRRTSHSRPRPSKRWQEAAPSEKGLDGSGPTRAASQPISRGTLGRASPAGPEAHACRSNAARTGTRRRSAYSDRKPPRC